MKNKSKALETLICTLLSSFILRSGHMTQVVKTGLDDEEKATKAAVKLALEQAGMASTALDADFLAILRERCKLSLIWLGASVQEMSQVKDEDDEDKHSDPSIAEKIAKAHWQKCSSPPDTCCHINEA